MTSTQAYDVKEDLKSHWWLKILEVLILYGFHRTTWPYTSLARETNRTRLWQSRVARPLLKVGSFTAFINARLGLWPSKMYGTVFSFQN